MLWDRSHIVAHALLQLHRGRRYTFAMSDRLFFALALTGVVLMVALALGWP